MPDVSPATDATAVITRDALAELLAKATARWQALNSASSYSGLSVPTLRRMLASGLLTAYRPVKGRVLIDRFQLDNLISSSTATPRKGRGRGRGLNR